MLGRAVHEQLLQVHPRRSILSATGGPEELGWEAVSRAMLRGPSHSRRALQASPLIIRARGARAAGVQRRCTTGPPLPHRFKVASPACAARRAYLRLLHALNRPCGYFGGLTVQGTGAVERLRTERALSCTRAGRGLFLNNETPTGHWT